MPAVAMKHKSDPREELLERVGDVNWLEIPDCMLLLAVYMRPERTAGNIILTARNLEEDLYQSKVGLVIKIGYGAKYNNRDVELHEWLVVRPSDCWDFDLIRPAGPVRCRTVYDKHIRGKVTAPGFMW
jgi:hypothetical protein